MTLRVGGWCAFADPNGSALSAEVFWRPDISAFVFPLQAAPSAGRATALDIAALRCRTATLVMRDQTRHILITRAGRRLQLFVRGSLDGPFRLLTDAIIDPTALAHRILLLSRLADLVARGDMVPRLYRPDARGRRLAFVLQALDGHLAAAPYREIAIALFGVRRVDADWRDPRHHLLDRVRRAVHRGQLLMRGGYLDFLK